MTIPMRRVLVASSAGAFALVVGAGVARAQQLDVNPPLPNVLLLIDNSGSMERMIDGSLPEANSNGTNACNVTCNTANPPTCTFGAVPTAPNRWNTLLQALVGSPTNGYGCIAMPRTAGSTFATEYQINSIPPYDTGYYLQFHRPVAKDTSTTPPTACVYAPGALPGAATPAGVGDKGYGAGGKASDFPGNAIITRAYGNLDVNTSGCQYQLNSDGALGSFQDLMRFSLMTFDQDTDPGIGVTTGANPQVGATPFTGMWSYFPGWNGTGAAVPATGKPLSCQAAAQSFEVGARNPAAPPWEGRMIPFPADEKTSTRESVAGNIQTVLMATRPYGATPLAGMFADAQYYYWNDPTGPNGSTGGVPNDAYAQGGCRDNYVILLTDGAPNLDLRPDCGVNDSPPTPCPYPHPEFTAASLLAPSASAPKVTTYVIGFAVSSVQDGSTLVNCSQLNTLTATQCTTGDPKFAACCELQRVAVAGGTQHAYFADTAGDLQKALGQILATIAHRATTRTAPVSSPLSTNVVFDPNALTQANQETFYASFNPSPGSPWSGDVQRQRFVCGAATQPTFPTVSSGDDFAANLNTATTTRNFIAFQPDPWPPGSTGAPDATQTIRPYYTKTSGGDGLPIYTATTYAGQALTDVLPNITPSALNLPATCPYTSNQGFGQQSMPNTECRNMLLDFAFGQTYSYTGRSDFTFVSRVGNEFGDVYHATPAVVPPPSALLRDDSYDSFRLAALQQPPSGNSVREQMVYVATNDGLLHAFWADETTNENNERWAMMLPAVMPNLRGSYPATDSFLLDGSPIVKDVVWERAAGNVGTSASWHTMLVAGYGPSQRGYYAVDVTVPSPGQVGGMTPAPGSFYTNMKGQRGGAPPPTLATTPPLQAPTFLWQLTRMPSTNAALFGAHSATPAITTLFMDPHDGNGARDIGVAILPGGWDSPPTTPANGAAGCGRALFNMTAVSSPAYSEAQPPTGFQARLAVRCWGAGTTGTLTDPVVGRSLTIVRLDTGEIVRVFMRASDVTNQTNDTLWNAKPIRLVTDTPLDSPMTGTPIVYPGDVGADATKIFVGDQDGTIWKFDVSNPDPTQWVGQLYLDLYNRTVDTSSTAWSDGEPIAVPPVISVDTAGSVVLNVATGSQDQFDSTGLNYVYSISEKVQGALSQLRAQVNWYMGSTTANQAGVLGQGERVSGPMTVFDGTLYFSTFFVPTGSLSCTEGNARLWGRNFITPFTTTDLSQGGAFVLPTAPAANPPNPPAAPSPPYLPEGNSVIPGVTVQASSSCATLGTGSSDAFMAGATHTSSTVSAGGFYLSAQLGKPAAGGGAQQFTQALPTPLAPTLIDSWAAVIE